LDSYLNKSVALLIVKRILPVFVVLICVYDLSAQDKKQYNSYCNHRFAYCIDYPKILKAQPEAMNGDGKAFKNKDGQDILLVFGGHTSMDDDGNELSFDDEYKKQLKEFSETKGERVTYTKKTDSYFVISGINDGKIFYQKTIQVIDMYRGDTGIGTAILNYPVVDSNIYKDYAAQLFRSFKYVGVK
jgi:hypothetical protein